MRGAILRDGTRDTGCGLKAFRRDVFLALPYFDGLHRFLPALVRREGYDDRLCRRGRPAAPRTACRTTACGTGCGSAFSICAGVWWLIRAQEACPEVSEVKMLIDLARAVGDYLHDVFVGNADWWVLLGFVAQVLFTMRFVVQWIASERAGKSVMPIAFWLFSIGGGLLLLVYALYRSDPVFIVGQAFGVFVYLRNLYFVLRERRAGRRRLRLLRCRQRRKAAFEIGDQIAGILEPDMEAHRRSARRPFGRGAVGRAIEQDGQALEAAPGCAHAEQRQLVDEGVHRRLRHRLEHDAEQAAGAGEVALPDGMAGIAFERGMQHAQHLRPLLEPARDLAGPTSCWCASRTARVRKPRSAR